MNVRVLYDFVGQDQSELTIHPGEELVITNENVGDGWWQARNSDGRIGLIPSAYVEQIAALPVPPYRPPPPPVNMEKTQEPVPDGWNDDWDSDDCEVSGPRADGGPASSKETSQLSVRVPQSSVLSSSAIRRLFSKHLVKSGIEEFFLLNGLASVAQPLHYIITNDDSFRWRYVSDVVHYEISSVQKDSKMKGIKSFIIYHVTPSNSGPFDHRYKHFDWCIERMNAMYPTLVIPSLPEKSLMGRFDDELVEHRRVMLQRWLNRFANHPVLSTSPPFTHLVSGIGEKEWKMGKRDVEGLRYQGARSLFIFESNGQMSQIDYNTQMLEATLRFIDELDRANRGLMNVMMNMHRRFNAESYRIHSEAATASNDVKKALSADVHCARFSNNLRNMFEGLENLWAEISKLHQQQSMPTNNLIDTMNEFSRIFPGVHSIYADIGRSTCHLQDELFKASEKYNANELETMNAGALVITRSLQAESNHYVEQYCTDICNNLGCYLRDRALFYTEIANKFNELATSYGA